ncbi:MAG: hypothetical protein J6C23_00905 [Clostridia bacterium]|nr:hypothetical protein [Clostridia bacterium]
MGSLLRLWQPKNKFCKTLKCLLRGIGLTLFVAFLVLPFIHFEKEINNIIKWVWIGCAVCNIDALADYKNYHNQKLISPIFTLFSILTLSYLYNYWALLSIAIIVCVSIVVGVLEFIISVAVYKTIRFSEKTVEKELPSKAMQGIVLGGLYACAVILFVLGHYVSLNTIFVFGSISAVMLSIAVLVCIGNGFSTKKSIFSIVSFIVDSLSLLALIIYLIYLIPNDKNLQDIVLAIVASVVGGALTLGGVAWTIKKADKDRKEDDKKKYRPIVNFFGVRAKEISGKFLINSDFEGSSSNLFINRADEATTYKIHNLICKNTDFSPFYLSGIIVNKVKFYSNVKRYVDKNDYLGFGFNTLLYSNKEIKYISLIVQDLLGNEYKIPIKFEVNGDDEKLIEIKDTGFACDIDTEECDERF